ncbi:hypothetical protein JTE90_008195 [Oedothorax gibbosus]|uniref:IRF tryptophan pentad repeat domain-containing protein n=1 Tax=Oedothorax gibbosus TaxID=931172 RepID=A0AAV6VG86_9ARAC|nr:hypothetical protein JTE90_008195 [Oedothorax gibbosus]
MPRQAYKLLEDFLIPALDDRTYGHLLEWERDIKLEAGAEGSTWVVFRIAWMHKAKSTWRLSDLRVFLDWDALKDRYPPPGSVCQGRPPPGSVYDKFLVYSKQRLRSALRNISYVSELPPEGDYKRYRILDLEAAKQARQNNHKLEKKKIELQRRHSPLGRPSSPEAPATSASRLQDGTKTKTKRKAKVKQEVHTDDDEEDKDDPTYHPRTSRTRSGRSRRSTRMSIKQEVEEQPSRFSAVSPNPTEAREIPRPSNQVIETPLAQEAGLFATASEETPELNPPKTRMTRELACLLEDQAKSVWNTATEPKRKSKVSQNSWADSFEKKQGALKETLMKIKDEPVWTPVRIPKDCSPSYAGPLPSGPTAFIRFTTFDYGTSTDSEHEVDVLQGTENGHSTALNLNGCKGIVSKKNKPRHSRKKTNPADSHNSTSMPKQGLEYFQKRPKPTDPHNSKLMPKQEPKDFQPSRSNNLYSTPSTSGQSLVYENGLSPMRQETRRQSCTSQAENDQETERKRKPRRKKQKSKVAKKDPLNLPDLTPSIPNGLEYGAQSKKENGVRYKCPTTSTSKSDGEAIKNNTLSVEVFKEPEYDKFSLLLKPDSFYGACVNHFTLQLLDGSGFLEQVVENQWHLDNEPLTYNEDEYYKKFF